MKQYGLSEQRIKRVIRNPERVEKGIVPGMIASMQISGTSKNKYEVWVMYEVKTFNGKQKSHKEDSGFYGSNNGNSELSYGNFYKKNKVKFQTSSFKSQTMSPAQKFRLERQEAFLIERDMSYRGKKLCIISTWKYPGESPKRDPIPQDILKEIRKFR